MEKALPKTIQAWIAAHPGKVETGHTELDYFGGDRTPWSHWVYLMPGWRNPVRDPMVPTHLIHETSTTEVLYQLRRVAPCDCEQCERELARGQ